MITQELVKNIFDYREGFLYWKYQRSNRIKAGDRVGVLTIGHNNVLRYTTKINQKRYLCSRIIFLWNKGYLPTLVDHKDRNTLNDKIENLREATHSQNNKNKRSQLNSASTYLGVSIHNNNKSWRARIVIEGKNKHLGTFKTEDEAAIAYNKAAIVHHKEFANLNIININS